MQRKAIISVGLLALVGLPISGGYYSQMALSVETIQLFLGLSLGTCLLLLLAHIWVYLYLHALGRELYSLTAAGESSIAERVVSLRRQTSPWLLAASLLGLVLFFLGKLSLNTTVPESAYFALLGLTFLVQALTVWKESRSLRGSEEALRELDSAPVGALGEQPG